MRFLILLAALLLAACGGADVTPAPDATRLDGAPVDAPVDAPETPDSTAPEVAAPDEPPADTGEPCGGLCGPGTVCEGGRCVAPDAGALDASPEAAADAGSADTALDADAEADVPADAVGDVATDSDVSDVAASLDVAACRSMTPGNCCGVACAVPPTAAAATCVAGRCGVVCPVIAGAIILADCDGNPANGCEVDLRTSDANCGACDAPCAPHRLCAGRACAACASNYADCNGNPVDGCEAHFTSDVANCGVCGNRCQDRANAEGRCDSGACVTVCRAGFADCDHSGANGCETAVLDNNANCGVCGNRCLADFHCVEGVCAR